MTEGQVFMEFTISSCILFPDNCGVVESVKAVSEIFSPVSGTISNINQEVVDEPALINKSCMDKGLHLLIFFMKTNVIESYQKLTPSEILDCPCP